MTSMTSIVPHVTPKTTNLSPASKRRRILPMSPGSHSAHHESSPQVLIPSIPSLSKIDDNTSSLEHLLSPTNRPRQRTESFDVDGAFSFDPAFVSPIVGQMRPRSNSNADRPNSNATADHCVDHNSCNKRSPPFAAKESDTFAAFTKPAKGSSFGASSSFIGLRGLLPDDARASQSSLVRLLRRNSSSNVGLDMNNADEDDDVQPPQPNQERRE